MELKETNHNYYCSVTNYYVGNRHGENYGTYVYDTWDDFKEEWRESGIDVLDIDIDYNYCFRFDIKKRDNETYSLMLFFMLQRKGIFRPVFIGKIEEADMKEISTFLQRQWDYTKEQWAEFSGETNT